MVSPDSALILRNRLLHYTKDDWYLIFTITRVDVRAEIADNRKGPKMDHTLPHKPDSQILTP